MTDLALNGIEASDTLSWTYDITRPDIVLSSSVTEGYSNNPAVDITVTFSEYYIQNFDASVVNTTNAAVASFAGAFDVYTFNLESAAEGEFTVWIHDKRCEVSLRPCGTQGFVHSGVSL
jgi:hypothetical protein